MAKEKLNSTIFILPFVLFQVCLAKTIKSIQNCNHIKSESKYRAYLYDGMTKAEAKKEIAGLLRQIQTEKKLKIPGYKKQIEEIEKDIKHIKRVHKI